MEAVVRQALSDRVRLVHVTRRRVDCTPPASSSHATARGGSSSSPSPVVQVLARGLPPLTCQELVVGWGCRVWGPGCLTVCRPTPTRTPSWYTAGCSRQAVPEAGVGRSRQAFTMKQGQAVIIFDG